MHLCRALLLGYPESVKFSLLRRLYNSDIHSFTEFTFVIQQSTLSIYTDGSGIDGHIGAAAVSPQISGIMHQDLGSDKEYNIYAAEIAGVELAADIALSSPTSYTKCIIYIDS